MSLDPLGRLEGAHEALIAALDRNDIVIIERRLEELKAALTDVRAAGAWRDAPEHKARAERIVRLGQAIRIRVNFLTDQTRHRLQLLAAARGDRGGSVYGRPAKAIRAG